MKQTILILLTALTFCSCANEKTFYRDVPMKQQGSTETYKELVIVQPTGWLEGKEKGVRYSVSGGSIFWSVVLCETIVAPFLITAWWLWEPVAIEECYPNCDKVIRD